jgi:hypothetical protein
MIVHGVGAVKYRSLGDDDGAWPPRFCKVELHFDDGTKMAFCDSRRFARVPHHRGHRHRRRHAKR